MPNDMVTTTAATTATTTTTTTATMAAASSDRSELRRCVMHMWPSYDGMGLNLKNSRKSGQPHVIRDVDVGSPAYYAGVHSNDLILSVGERQCEFDKFDTLLKLIREQLRRDNLCDLVVLNQSYYAEFRRRNHIASSKQPIDLRAPHIAAQIRTYQSPVHNPNVADSSAGASLGVGTLVYGEQQQQRRVSLPLAATSTANNNNNNMSTTNISIKTNGGPIGLTTSTSTSTPTPTPNNEVELRMCHLLTWPHFDGYGFFVYYTREGCFVKDVEANSPAQLGGLLAADRILEINGKRVRDIKDRELVVKEIDKLKRGGGGTGTFGTTKSSSGTSAMRSRSAYSVVSSPTATTATATTATSTPGEYLNLLVADKASYEWLVARKVDVSSAKASRASGVRVRDCYTPSLAQLRSQQQQQQQPMANTLSSVSMVDLTAASSTRLQQPAPPSIAIKRCTVRRRRVGGSGANSEQQIPLGFEMTKRGAQAHFISRVDGESAASAAGLEPDDYLIELNGENIEHDDNMQLRSKMVRLLDNAGAPHFVLTTINKQGYEHCIANGISSSLFIQSNKSLIKTFDPPALPPAPPQPQPQVQKQQQQQQQSRPASPDPATTATTTTTSMMLMMMPRLCMIRKRAEERELGFAIARIKNRPGHYINDVVGGSAAERAGLRAGDRLLEINGENIEALAHAQVVKRIIELAGGADATINLLVQEKDQQQQQQQQQQQTGLVSSSSSTSTSAMANVSSNVYNPMADVIVSSVATAITTTTNVPINNSSTNNSNGSTSTSDLKNNVLVVHKHEMQQQQQQQQQQATQVPSINVYPEIKICEFIGYPTGTQLGLVVTSDAESHDVVKVADDSPAERAGLRAGDVLVAINGVDVQGDQSAIDLLNQFSETRALRILAASRYTLEWSKLLRIKVVERDWPNVKKFTTKYVPPPPPPPLPLPQPQPTTTTVSVSMVDAPPSSQKIRVPIVPTIQHSIYATSSSASAAAGGNYYDQTSSAASAAPVVSPPPPPLSSTVGRSTQQQQQRLLMRNEITTTTTTTNTNERVEPAISHESANNNNNNKQQQHFNHYSEIPISRPLTLSKQSSAHTSRHYQNQQQQQQQQQQIQQQQQQQQQRRLLSTSAHSVNNQHHQHHHHSRQQQHQQQQQITATTSLSLSRSAVDITADGRVLRMCTLLLDPHSANPNDSEFGFDLVTRVGSQRIGDYFIDTIDDDSPAFTSGLKSGDRLVEVDDIDVRNKTFEQVVQLINEAKLKAKLRLLVYPSGVINYGNPSVLNATATIRSTYNGGDDDDDDTDLLSHHLQQQQQQHFVTPPPPALFSENRRSMPDLLSPAIYYQQQQQQQQQAIDTSASNSARSHFEKSTSSSANRQQHTHQTYYSNTSGKKDLPTYSILKAPHQQQQQQQHTSNSNITSSSNTLPLSVYARNAASLSKSTSNMMASSTKSAYLRPVPRLCTVYKKDARQLATAAASSQNIGFGVQAQSTHMVPNYIRVSIVNYKSPAYLAGLSAGDFIVEINGRNTLTMSHDEGLRFIKASYDLNSHVKLLVVSEFSYNWLREHDLLHTITSDNQSVFSYADYLKNNHRYVPRLCQIKLLYHTTSFGFQVETMRQMMSVGGAPSYAHMIVRVERESPSYVASVQKGDRIVECDGINVETENEEQVYDRIQQALVNVKRISLLVVDTETDNYFKSKCIKLHSMLPIVQHITNTTDV